MKTKSTFYNAAVSIIYYIITILLGICNQKVLIAVMGIEYQGMNGLFSNVISMLSIAELGIGVSIIYHLYEPLEKNDISVIQSLMNFYRKCYIGIAVFILGAGVLIIPGLKHMIHNYSGSHSLFAIYIWFLLDSVCSYLFSYKRSILIADQKNYIVVSCDILYQIGSKLGQILILICTHDFIKYLSVMVMSRLINNLIITYIANRRYPYLKRFKSQPLSFDILTDIKKKIKGSFFHKIGGFVVMGTDNILISKFLGLAAVGIYSNYSLVINSIKNVCSQTLKASTASVGHLLVGKQVEKNKEIFTELQIINGVLTNCAVTGIYCVTTPLIEVIFGKQYLVPEFTLFVLSVNFYVAGMRTVYGIFKDAGGIQYEDRWIPVAEAGVNLIASLIFLHYFGLAGVPMGTIVSSLLLFGYTYPYLIYKRILYQSIRSYWKELLWLGLVSLISMISAKMICNCVIFKDKMIQIGFNVIISVFISNGLFYFLYACWKKETKALIVKCKMFCVGSFFLLRKG